MFFLSRKIGNKPFGIWLAWLALAYSLIVQIKLTAVLLGLIDNIDWMPRLSQIVIGWPVLIVAIITLAMRRFISTFFIAMALVSMISVAIDHIMPFGIAIAVAGLLGLYPNRCWFDEYLPKIGWR